MPRIPEVIVAHVTLSSRTNQFDKISIFGVIWKNVAQICGHLNGRINADQRHGRR